LPAPCLEESSVEIKGTLAGWFETGSEGTYWTLQDEKHIDDKGMYSYEGMHVLKSGMQLVIHYPKSDKVYWEGQLVLVPGYDPKLLKKLGLHYYVKKHPSGLKQLSLGGYWIHNLPVGFDLAIWYRIFFLDEGWTGTLTLIKD